LKCSKKIVLKINTDKIKHANQINLKEHSRIALNLNDFIWLKETKSLQIILNLDMFHGQVKITYVDVLTTLVYGTVTAFITCFG
jgi:hypothetical protein